MSPERAGSPLGLEPRELALALQSAVPPFKLVRLNLDAQNQTATATESMTVTSATAVVKRGPSGNNGSGGGGVQDDDLTSLTWLQDNNLLKGMNLSCVKTEPDDGGAMAKLIAATASGASTPPQQQSSSHLTFCAAADQSPTSDYMDDSSISEPTDSSSSSLNSPVPYSYSGGTTSTTTSTPVNGSPGKASKHPHNVKYDPMVHTFSKPPYSFSCLIFMAIEDSPLKALPVKDIYAWILDHFPYFKNAPTGWKNSVRHNLSLNKCFQKVEKSPSLGKGSLWMVDQQYRPNLLQALTRSPFHPCSTLDPATFRSASSRTSSPFVQQMIDTKSSTRLPNPELFPYLSRRLAASEAGRSNTGGSVNVGELSIRNGGVAGIDDAEAATLDDVHAATAILALKHGHSVFSTPVELVQVITRSPSEDHTYSTSTTVTTTTIKQERPASPDEAFESDDSANSRMFQSSLEPDEQRRIEEGADALLNLAGIATSRSSRINNNNYVTSTPVTKRRRTNSDGDFEPLMEIKCEQEEATSEFDDNELVGRHTLVEQQSQQREHKFRPRMLRTKRHQSKRSRVTVNNNNNIVVQSSKTAAKLAARKAALLSQR